MEKGNQNEWDEKLAVNKHKKNLVSARSAEHSNPLKSKRKKLIFIYNGNKSELIYILLPVLFGTLSLLLVKEKIAVHQYKCRSFYSSVRLPTTKKSYKIQLKKDKSEGVCVCVWVLFAVATFVNTRTKKQSHEYSMQW